MRAEAEGGVVSLRPIEVVYVGRRAPDVLVTVGRGDEHAQARARRELRPADLGGREDPARLRPDRRHPAQTLLDRVPHEPSRIGRDCCRLARFEQPGDRRPRGVPRLLHPAQQDHLERRKDRRDPLCERALRVQEHRRDRAPVRLLPEPFEDRSENAVDLGPNGIGDGPPRGVVLEVDRALREPVEPATQSDAVDLPEAEDQAERENRDRFEVLAHQLCLAAILDRNQQPRDVGFFELRRRRLDDARAQRRVEHRPEPLLRLAVEHEDALAAHRPVEGRGGHGRVDQLRMRRGVLDVDPAGHEPEPDGRHVTDGRLAPHPRVDRIGIVVELLDGDRHRPLLD